MANYEYIKGKGNRFTSENQPQNRGRKPKLYTIAKKAYNVSREEWDKTKLYLLQATPKEIDKIISSGDTPMWVLILARGLKRNAAKGMTDVLNDMEDRLFGKATNSVDVTTNGKDVGQQIVFSPTPLSEQDIQEIKDIHNGNKESGDNAGVSET